ncbi:Rv3654c family TadE-like protein [Allorhizocola rhizosphaerae]|uniref:Rv3654c family TadE-like protein n=1 Tax=Allorhizocola rhizosphaerae TaxID=1872709 RepID=UPI000E3C46ED|nr:Rv3654c family TadE-like protein [Allorhizocola rhizosphaerae]
MRRVRDDRGSATIVAAAIGLALVLAGAGLARAAAWLIARAQAGVAADMGALAGAMRGFEGRDAACARAAAIAARNGAEVVSCQLDGLDLTVTVRLRDSEATARAGPVRADPDPAGPNDADPMRAGLVAVGVGRAGPVPAGPVAVGSGPAGVVPASPDHADPVRTGSVLSARAVPIRSAPGAAACAARDAE